MGKQEKYLSFFFYLIVFFIPLTIYILTLAPTVTFGDSGELIAASYPCLVGLSFYLCLPLRSAQKVSPKSSDYIQRIVHGVYLLGRNNWIALALF